MTLCSISSGRLCSVFWSCTYSVSYFRHRYNSLCVVKTTFSSFSRYCCVSLCGSEGCASVEGVEDDAFDMAKPRADYSPKLVESNQSQVGAWHQNSVNPGKLFATNKDRHRGFRVKIHKKKKTRAG